MIGDLTNDEVLAANPDLEPTLPSDTQVTFQSFTQDEAEGSYIDMGSTLTDEEEDALLKVPITF